MNSIRFFFISIIPRNVVSACNAISQFLVNCHWGRARISLIGTDEMFDAYLVAFVPSRWQLVTKEDLLHCSNCIQELNLVLTGSSRASRMNEEEELVHFKGLGMRGKEEETKGQIKNPYFFLSQSATILCFSKQRSFFNMVCCQFESPWLENYGKYEARLSSYWTCVQRIIAYNEYLFKTNTLQLWIFWISMLNPFLLIYIFLNASQKALSVRQSVVNVYENQVKTHGTSNHS